VELLHAASLAHDDVLDEEHVRRGVRSLNREHGNQVAVLSGDVLYAKFFALLTRVELPDPGRLSTLFALFARTTERMCIGIVTK
jgi:geranylgeranyl pyrophosphate synthase